MKLAITTNMRILTTGDYIRAAKAVHGTKYDYSDAKFTKLTDAITIKCPKHGYFTPAARLHLKGSGCAHCAQSCYTKVTDTESFIVKANRVHSNKYDYSKVDYRHSQIKVSIQCKVEGHGFFMQAPNNHLSGHGCPICRLYTLGSVPNKAKKYKLGKKEVSVTGTEAHTLDYLVNTKCIPASDIRVGKDVPLIHFTVKGRKRTYVPDVFIPKEHRIIESKSLYTFIGTQKVFKANCEKAVATLAQGYKYNLIVMGSQVLIGEKRYVYRIRLPRDWYNLTYSEAIASVFAE